jgi:hypothetical protein
MPPINEAPATPDQPALLAPLDLLLHERGVPRSLPPELLSFARENDLVLRAEEEGTEPGGETGTETDPNGGEEPGSETPESFMDFDPASIPEDADREWLANRYGEMNKHFTQRMQEIGDGRREAEESQALIEGLRDPETRPHYLRLLGVDLLDPQQLQALGIDVRQADDELSGLLDDEPDLEDRLGKLESERAEERQQREENERLEALDGLADEELEAIEGQWGRKLSKDEDKFLRFNAESNPGPDGLPDYAKAAKLLKGILNSGVEQELKRRQEPGRGAPGGKPGGKALDPNKEEDRLALAAAAAEKAMASEQ